ncbi:MAG TPA: GntR family transcriptional regulator [Caulobacterales bacterium]|jgi:DNA-binding GntR family transcriptional regulator|nr:GntR family transcriptional regulator [Caulobacterales bacterium]
MATVTSQRNTDINVGEIVAALEEEIALGYLAPRERLVEEELAERFQVKRHVIRQALVELDAMGIVVRQPNRGAAVKDFTVNEVEQLYIVRSLVECCAAELIPMPAPASLINELRAIHKRHCDAVDRGDLSRVFRENLKFHRTLFASCGNVPLTEIIEQLAFKTHGIRSYSVGDPKLLARVRAEHERMIELLQGASRRELVALIKGHIQPAKDAYLQVSQHKTAKFVKQRPHRS